MSTQTKTKTSAARPAAPKAAAKKPVVKSAAAKSSFAGTADLYVINGVKKLDAAHQFNKQISSIYGVEEYVWTGALKAGAVKFVRPSARQVPTNDVYNSGYTLVGKAQQFFAVDEALTANSENGDQIYNYGNPRTVLRYVGPAEEHTLYVRIYDNAAGEPNDRWLTLAIE